MTKNDDKQYEWKDCFGYGYGEKEKSTIVEAFEAQGLTAQSLIDYVLKSESEDQFMKEIFVRKTIRANINLISSDVLSHSEKDKATMSLTSKILDYGRKPWQYVTSDEQMSENTKFKKCNYDDFVNKAKPMDECKKIIQEYLEPFMQTKSYQDLVNLDKLPENGYFKDKHNLLKNDPNRKNPLYQNGIRVYLELDNLEQPDAKIDEKISNIRDKIKEAELVYFFGPRTSGKSRTVYEFLSRQFGIYLTARSFGFDGSQDLETLTKTESYTGNQSIRFVLRFLNIITIRTMVLEVLREAQVTRGQPPLKPWHWLIIQIMSGQVFGMNNRLYEHDTFQKLSENLNCLNAIDRVFNNDQIKTPENRFPVFVDEIKEFTASKKEFLSPESFYAAVEALKEGREYPIAYLVKDRPLINMIIYASRLSGMSDFDENFLFILVGSSLPSVDHLASTEWNWEYKLESFKKKTVYLTLGNFSDFESFKEYIKRYTDTLDHRLAELHSILRGRYGFTSVFLNKYLTSGDIDKAIKETSESIGLSLEGSIKAHISSDYNFCLIRDFVYKSPCAQHLLLEYLFGKLEPIGFAAGKDESIDDEIALIRCSLAQVAPTTREPVLAFSQVSDFVREIKIAEPIVFENLHYQCRDRNSYKNETRFLNHIYLEAWRNTYEMVCNFNPDKLLGHLCEPFAHILFVFLYERDYIPLLRREIDAECSIAFNFKVRFPYWIDCNQEGVNYSLNEFLAQDFANRMHMKVGISLKRCNDLPSFLFVVEPYYVKEKPRLVVVQTMNTPTNERSHFDALEKWPELEQFSQTIRILMQVGNNDQYREKPGCKVIVKTRNSIIDYLGAYSSAYKAQFKKSK